MNGNGCAEVSSAARSRRDDYRRQGLLEGFGRIRVCADPIEGLRLSRDTGFAFVLITNHGGDRARLYRSGDAGACGHSSDSDC